MRTLKAVVTCDKCRFVEEVEANVSRSFGEITVSIPLPQNWIEVFSSLGGEPSYRSELCPTCALAIQKGRHTDISMSTQVSIRP